MLPWFMRIVKLILILVVLNGLLSGCASLNSKNIYQVEEEILFNLPYGRGIIVMGKDGNNLTELVSFGWNPAVSRDNKKIAFSEYYNNGVWVANRDGSNQQKLTSFGGTPSWSPDGKRIVFSDNTPVGSARSVWVMDSDGSNMYKLTNTPGSKPRWSHNGEKIIFHGEVNAGIFVINSDGAGEQRLAGGYYPRYSPDDTKIVYIGRDWTVWKMDATGRNPVKLSSIKAVAACFSSDNSEIVFAGLDSGIYTMDAGSGEVKIHNDGRSPVYAKKIYKDDVIKGSKYEHFFILLWILLNVIIFL